MKRIVGSGTATLASSGTSVELEIDISHNPRPIQVDALRFVTNQPEHCRVESVIIDDRIDRVNAVVAAFDRVMLADEDPALELPAQRCYRYPLSAWLGEIATPDRRIIVRVAYYTGASCQRNLEVALAVEGRDDDYHSVGSPS